MRPALRSYFTPLPQPLPLPLLLTLTRTLTLTLTLPLHSYFIDYLASMQKIDKGGHGCARARAPQP